MWRRWRLDPMYSFNFVLEKILRIDPTDPLSYRLQLTDQDIDTIISGKHRVSTKQEFLKKGSAETRKSKTNSNQKEEPDQLSQTTTTRKALEDDDKCSIYQETMTEPELLLDNRLCYCNQGCGSNFHMKCYKILQAHTRSERKKVACPLCRALCNVETILPLVLKALKRQREYMVYSNFNKNCVDALLASDASTVT